MGLNKNSARCSDFHAQLEDTAGSVPAATSVSELLAALPDALRQHGQACGRCREAAEHLLLTRQILSARPSAADSGGPWFASRVMAAIAQRKAELARAADTWTFLARPAARLIWASSVALLLASAWLYQKPSSTPVETSAKAVATDITGEPVADSTTLPSHDDVLVSLAEKKPQ